jgi:hypothetical protein
MPETKTNKCNKYRKIADRVWQLAAESPDYETEMILKDIAASLHYLARQAELGEKVSDHIIIDLPSWKSKKKEPKIPWE